jgi:ABC-2 type transport system permease protein
MMTGNASVRFHAFCRQLMGLDGIRRVLIQGEELSQVHEPLLTLIGFLAVLLPFSLWVFGRAVRRAKREGSLIQY